MARSSPKLLNIADALRRAAYEAPDRIAMHLSDHSSKKSQVRYRTLTYRELDQGSDEIAFGLLDTSIGQGTRVALMVRPGESLFLLMFALFKCGAVPVLIDPGIQRSALKACLAQAAPEVFIGIPIAHCARLLLGWARHSIRINITVGRRWFWSGHTLSDIRRRGKNSKQVLPQTTEDSTAAILFTSGSTGIPKGVEYKHRHFAAQIELIRTAFSIQSGEVDLPTFPPFALFDPGLGMTSVIPSMDPTRPAKANPKKLIETINQHSCTTMFGSPALLDNVSRYAQQHAIRCKTLKRILSAGAPVTPDVIKRAYAMLPDNAEVWTPYGATECLPVSIIEGREILATAREKTDHGAGICVGRPLPQNTVRIIRICDEAIEHWSDDLLEQAGIVGEITVVGPTTTEAYFRNPKATGLAKIKHQHLVVHRMGDVGYFDPQGLLWYCGRKSHRVLTNNGTLYTEMVEGIINTHPEVKRCALVGVGQSKIKKPVLCIELMSKTSRKGWLVIHEQLRLLAQTHFLTQKIQDFFLYGPLPVDIRHNAKINREKLSVWANLLGK
jgi:acyl-CoA synthetase (AMP-forming)/AMP-acid ligase II